MSIDIDFHVPRGGRNRYRAPAIDGDAQRKQRKRSGNFSPAEFMGTSKTRGASQYRQQR
jgi:hypothetical protein